MQSIDPETTTREAVRTFDCILTQDCNELASMEPVNLSTLKEKKTDEVENYGSMRGKCFGDRSERSQSGVWKAVLKKVRRIWYYDVDSCCG